MIPPIVATAIVWEDTAPICLARVVGNAGTAITQATISSINRKVFDKFAGTQISSTAVTVSSAVFDTLQTDARWTADSTGYNFADQPAAADFADPNKTYRIEFTFTPTSGEVFKVVFECVTREILGS